jgi:tartrate dehydrogenase/decarboxylase/D-malate dehydrogenase
MREYRLAVIPADGIGQETVPGAMRLRALLAEGDGGFRVRRDTFPWDSDYYVAHGAMMPANALQTLDSGFDAIYLGPVGDPRLPDDVTLWGLLIPIRRTFDQYVNPRPNRLLAGVPSPVRDKRPADIDLVLVRENTEGEYAGVGGRVHHLRPGDRQPDRRLLVAAAHARLPGRARRGQPADARGRGRARTGQARTLDLGGRATTAELSQAIAAAVRRLAQSSA